MKKHLLLLHGALGSGAQLKLIDEELKPYYQTHLINFEGHGNSLSEKAFTIDLFSENVSDYMADQGIDSVDIFGYSMGGYVALYLAWANPKLVRKIVTYGTKFNWSPEGALKETRMLDPVTIQQKVPAYAAYLQDIHQEAGWTNVLQKTSAMMLSLGNEPLLSFERLGQIPHPVLIGLGGMDQMVSREESEAVVSHLPNGDLTILEGYKHPIEKVAPDVIGDMIRNFIEN